MNSLVTQKIKSFKNKITSKGVILMYHRVEELDYDPWNLGVSPKNFEEHLKVLQKRKLGISLKAMTKRHQQNKLGSNSLTLTFDDGYGDNYRNAKPLLEKYAVPATFFIATAYINKKKEFWWDELENILFATPVLPDRLQVTALGGNYSWDLTNDDSLPNTYQDDIKNWRVDVAFKNSRQKAFLELWTLLKPLSSNQQEEIMAQLRKYTKQKPRAHNFPMSSKQLLDLAENNLFCLGAHTCNHLSLPALNLENQSAEISGSIRALENLLGRQILTFAYPYGDISENTEKLLEEQHISVACTTESKAVSTSENRLALPRFQVLNWSGEEFDYQLNKWFNLLSVNNFVK